MALVGGPIHFAYGFDTLSHLGPGYVALALIGVGLYLSRPGR